MQWVVSLVAVLGVGSVSAACIGWFVAISNHRQAWINALRDDVATFLKELEIMHYAFGDLIAVDAVPEAEKRKREARVALLFTYSRIKMRLNQAEPQHTELCARLDALMVVTMKVPDRAKVDATVDLAREVFKREWEVTKFGVLAPVVAKLKRLRQSN